MSTLKIYKQQFLRATPHYCWQFSTSIPSNLVKIATGQSVGRSSARLSCSGVCGHGRELRHGKGWYITWY